MRIITGDECGLLKETIPELSRLNSDVKQSYHHTGDVGVTRLDDFQTDGELNMARTRGVVDLAFCELDSTHDDYSEGSISFCALRINGNLEKWEGFCPNKSKEDRICGGVYKLSEKIDNVFESQHKSEISGYVGRPVAMCASHPYQKISSGSHTRNVITCCSSSGIVSVIDVNDIQKGIVSQYDAYSKDNADRPKIQFTKADIVNRDIATAMAMSTDAQKIVVGGRERAATMIDVETGKKIWKAKNLPPNPQTLLQQPIWSTAIQFLSNTDTSPINGSKELLAVGTAYKQLQIYDIRANATQRRPVLYTPEWDSTKDNILEHRVTSLCQTDCNNIVVGDSAGYIHSLDLRMISNKHGRSFSANVGRFNGPAGSVRQIVKHQTLPIIACVSLDRMLRTFDIKRRKQLDCVYLKQRLNCMLFCPDKTWNNSGSLNPGREDSDEQEYRTDTEDEGDIDDEDEVEDYINSSDEDSSGDQSDETSSSEDEEPRPKKRR